VNSESGTVTAELAIAMPAVVILVAFATGVLGVQVDRISLTREAAESARAAARGESIDKVQLKGNLVCVTKTKDALIPISETQCARRFGL
jgi:Flp pilus assembly protein TadG